MGSRVSAVTASQTEIGEDWKKPESKRHFHHEERNAAREQVATCPRHLDLPGR